MSKYRTTSVTTELVYGLYLNSLHFANLQKRFTRNNHILADLTFDPLLKTLHCQLITRSLC
jgi:hypothetical protein